MDPTISNFVRMICGVRQRPLVSPHLLNTVWSFGGLLKIADSTHAMDVPALPPHMDFVVLDISQGGSLLERWWIGSESSETYQNMTASSSSSSSSSKRNNNRDDDDDDDVSSEDSSTVAVRTSDVMPAVSFGPLKIIVRCVYAYLVASDIGIRGLNIRSSDAKTVIGPDTPLVVRVSKAGEHPGGELPRPTPVSSHTRSERPFCCDWRCDTGSPDLGTILVSVRRTFTPFIGTPPQRSPASDVKQQQQQQPEDRSSSANKEAALTNTSLGSSKDSRSSSQQQQHVDPAAAVREPPAKLVTPSLRGQSPESVGVGVRVTPPLAGQPQRSSSSGGGDDDDGSGGGLPPMSLPSAVNSDQHLLPPPPTRPTTYPARTLSGLGAPVVSNESNLSSPDIGPTTPSLSGGVKTSLPPPKLTPLLAASAFPNNNGGGSNTAAAAGKSGSADEAGGGEEGGTTPSASTPLDRRQSSDGVLFVARQNSSGGASSNIPTPTPEQQHMQRMMGTPQRSFDPSTQQLQPRDDGTDDSSGLGVPPPENNNTSPAAAAVVIERISDDNYGCAISTSSVFHSTNWSWEESGGHALLRPDPPQQCTREHRQILPGTLGRRSCFEDSCCPLAPSAGDDDSSLTAGRDEDAIVDVLRSLDDLEYVRAHCEARRALQHHALVKRSPATQQQQQPPSKSSFPSATEAVESVLDQLNAAQDSLMRLAATKSASGGSSSPSPMKF